VTATPTPGTAVPGAPPATPVPVNTPSATPIHQVQGVQQAAPPVAQVPVALPQTGGAARR